MADYITTNIRNIALIGHGSEGKTTLTEAMLYAAGLVDRQGRVEDGTTMTDFAQGLSEWEAALLGVYIHGRAGEIIEKEQGAYSLLARELAQKAGTAMTIQEEN